MDFDPDLDCHRPRRDFIKLTAVALGASGVFRGTAARGEDRKAAEKEARGTDFSSAYQGARLSRVAFPLGGIGAGMVCLGGSGAMSHVSVRNTPALFNEPCTFAAVSFPGKNMARVLEGPVPGWKLFGLSDDVTWDTTPTYGLPRYRQAEFNAQFPFARVTLRDDELPFAVELTAWSPFTPGDADRSSLPVAALEYRLTNHTETAVDAVFSYNARNFMATHLPTSVIRPLPGGFSFRGSTEKNLPADEGFFAATVDDPAVKVNHAWFRGSWYDPLTMAWNDVARGVCVERPPVTDGPPAIGASLFVPFRLAPGASRTITVRLCWYVPRTNLNRGKDPVPPAGAEPKPAEQPTHVPWYASRFRSIEEVARHWAENYDRLRHDSLAFADCFQDQTLPPELLEAVSANLGILKSPTLLRQADGALWGWEGCNDNAGAHAGSCTHVYNYAQALAHLFPALERTLRETEFGPSQDERGHQNFRASLPIRPAVHEFHAAADGQLGGIMKIHRDWRISGDTAWLRRWWPRVRQSLDYCIETWDPSRKGWLEEPHHNTYDIEFWGPDGMCTSIYLGALQAAVTMGRALGEDIGAYDTLLRQGRARAETELFDGEYFFQKVEWKHLRAGDPTKSPSLFTDYSPEARALLEKEGPKYQYGSGCLSDGVIGSWLAEVCGVIGVLDPAKVRTHLVAVHRHNLKTDLTSHANPQRPIYAAGQEGGLLLCTWPKGGAPSLPFVYSNEVWTGIEYQVASHLIMAGEIERGCEIVRVCRARYDGRFRNPFDEYEGGDFYARALSSYALLQAWSGARYDAVDQVLHLHPPHRRDFRCFLATATGYGTVGVREGKPFLEVRSGTIPVASIDYRRPGHGA